jgi:TolB-like protein/Flp pilus assembly protein TadD
VFGRATGNGNPGLQSNPVNTAGPSPQLVSLQLEKMLSSETWVHSPQLCRFLRFVVEKEVAGETDQLKEYVLGLEVLRKNESFDPRVDTGVRTEARRLRQKLAEYYQTEGRQDAIEIAVPKGSYRAVFTNRSETVPPAVEPASKAGRGRRRWIALGVSLAIAVALAGWLWSRTHASVRAPSIAVIPLENLSADPAEEYFSDGITDSLFTDLAKIHGLSVISRTSVMQYKRTQKTIPQIARELGVEYIVEGTVTRVGNRARISAQLIAAAADRHLWAESYDRTGSDILTLQAELAQAIAEQVHIHVTPQEQTRLAKHPTSLEAQDLYLKGRFNWQTRDTERMLKSIEYFNQAIAKEPEYALAFAGLADAYNVVSYRLGRKDYQARACEAARRALELDESLGEAHASMDGCLDLWDWRQRERHLRRAVELSPSYPTAHQWLGAMLIDLGRDREGLTEVRRAVELDPLGPSPNNALCMSLYMTRQYDQAIQHCLQALEVFPGYVEPYYGLGFAYTSKRMYPQAIAYLETAMKMTGGAPPVATLLAHAQAAAGDSSGARRLLQEFTARPDITPIMLAVLYLDVAEKDHAFEYLDKAVEERSFASDWMNVNPMLDSLHSDPRWAGLVRRMKLSN